MTSHQDFTILIPEKEKKDEVDFLKKLPLENYYIFWNWHGAEEDILFKSKFTRTVKSLYEGLNNISASAPFQFRKM